MAKKLSVPREMPEIQTEYNNLCRNAGQVQYQLKIYQNELDALNKRLENVNREAGARQQLDSQKAKLEGENGKV